MRAVAGRHLHARDRARIEARLVEHHHDVRRLVHRAGRVGGADGEPLAHAGVGLHHAARDQVADRGHAGAGELRHVVLGVEFLPRIVRHRERQRDEAAEAADRAGQRMAPPHPQRIEVPDQRQRDQRARDRDRHLGAELGEDVHQEREGVGVDDHQVDEVHRHQQHVVLELRQQDQHGEQGERQRGRDRGAAQQQQKSAIEQAPGQQIRGARHQRALGREQDRERRKMQHCQHAHAARRVRRRRRRTDGWSGKRWRAASTYAAAPGHC